MPEEDETPRWAIVLSWIVFVMAAAGFVVNLISWLLTGDVWSLVAMGVLVGGGSLLAGIYWWAMKKGVA